MQKILKWFTPIIAIGVAIFIIFFLISINSSSTIDNSLPLDPHEELVQKKQKKVWLSHFSKTQKLGYFYPVNEVYVQVDLNEKITNSITYELSASLLDPYQLFCLKEELKQHKLKYFLKKNNRNIKLLIYSQNKDRLNSLVKELKNYQITAEIMPYKEDI